MYPKMGWGILPIGLDIARAIANWIIFDQNMINFTSMPIILGINSIFSQLLT